MLKVLQGGKYSRCTAFVSACYNVHDATSMTESRIKVWIQKSGSKGAAATPKLCTLPPTNEAFKENIKRAHYQCCISRCALHQQPDFDPTEYGWVKDEVSKSVQPVTHPAATPPAPDYILKLTRCSCSLEGPCRSQGCGCSLEAVCHVRYFATVKAVPHAPTHKPELRKPLIMSKVTINIKLETLSAYQLTEISDCGVKSIMVSDLAVVYSRISTSVTV